MTSVVTPGNHQGRETGIDSVGKDPDVLYFDAGLKGLYIASERPEAVAQIEFLDWTEADRLRHSKFVGLREDKDPHQVVKEDRANRND